MDDAEYAVLGDQEYIETKDDEVAIISDFKKVVGYSGNPREIEAMALFVEKQRSQNKAQTDYEHFRSMLRQLEWKDLASLGVTKLSPFVGKAGIGAFEEKEDFKARLISDTARVGENGTFFAGLHVNVPGHLFMLATKLNDELQGPKIELTDLINVDSYEVFYPMPLPIVAHELIGVYRGDFAFPIKINVKEKNKPVSFKAKIAFQSCDTSFDCNLIEMAPALWIDAKEAGKPIWSSMSNFIHQSFYNLPKDAHKDLVLENVSFAKDDKGHVANISFDFAYHAKVRNFAFFLENEDGALFSFPEVIVGKDHIYVQTSVLEKTESLLEKPLVLNVRLNDFVAVRLKIDLEKYVQKTSTHSFFYLFVLAVGCGILFCLTPFAFGPSCMGFLVKNNVRHLIEYMASKALFICAAGACFLWQAVKDERFLYMFFTADAFKTVFLLFALFAFLFYINARLFEKFSSPIAAGAFVGGVIALCLSAVGFGFMQTFLSAFDKGDLITKTVLLYGGVLGLLIPDFCALYFRKRRFSLKVFELMLLVCQTMTYIAVAALMLHLFLPLTLKSFAVSAILLMVGLFVMKCIFVFWRALWKTDLPTSYILWTARVVCLIILWVGYGFSNMIVHNATIQQGKISSIDVEDVVKRAQNGENLIVGMTYPSCLICRYNDATSFNKALLKELKDEYKLSYLVQSETLPSQETIEFLKKYKRFSRPLYVLYTPLAPKGVILPDWVRPSDLEDIFDTFRIYPSSSKSEPKKSLTTNLR